MSVPAGQSWLLFVRRGVRAGILATLVLAGAARAARAQPVEPLAAPPTPPPAAAPSTAPGSVEETARSLHFKLKIATAAALLVTGALGGVLAYNLPNSLHDGACAGGDPWFGDYGCSSLGTVHGISAVVSIALYASTATLEFGLPNVPAPEKIARHRTLHRGLTYAHLAGIIVQPLLGIFSRFPDTIGIDDPGHQASFAKVTRTVHAGIGIATIAAYITTLALEW